MSHHIRTQFSITPWYGKQFPDDYLQHPDLEFYCDNLQAIPPHCPVKYNPSVHLSVEKLLSLVFPSHSHSLIVEAAGESFSNNRPNEILLSLIERAIPPPKFIQDLKSQFGQAVLNCRTSIKDPLYDNSFLPFWVLTLWERLAELNTARGEWLSATTWFKHISCTLGPTTVITTNKHLSRVGWGAKIIIRQEWATTLTLPQLLADACLNSAVLDLMAECIQMEAVYGGTTRVCVCGTVFTNKVAQLRTSDEESPDWFQKRFVHPIQNN